MRELRPRQFVLRCYGHKTSKGNWYGLCLDLNIGAEAESPEALKRKIGEMIASYLETVLDTSERSSISGLLSRRAPIKDWLIYYLITLAIFIKKIPGKFTFEEIVPFHLAHSCS